jgi:hypothetical protein
MNRIKQLQKRYRVNMLLVRKKLGWDEEQYGYYQYEMGLRYMREVLKLDEEIIAIMETSRKYWAWWVNQWNLFDECNWLPYANNIPANLLDASYRSSHACRMQSASPNRVILEESYCVMVGEFNRELKTAAL